MSENTLSDKTPQSPYINTTLVSNVMLNPNQMDNKFYLHLKSNLNNKLVGKCYLNFGFIINIYKLEEISEGIIEAEDPSCSAKIVVKFSCRLCFPPKNKYIICKIDRMNKALISAINGPIKVIITQDKINKEQFFSDSDRNILIKKNYTNLAPDMIVKILILSSTFGNYDTSILSIGYLQDLATPDEIKLYNEDENNINKDQKNNLILYD
jgi:DNA-directed RNA polymerase subunit E'/Rpb7